MTTYQTIRRRGLRKSANLPYAIKNSSQKSTKKAAKTADLEQEGNDEENLLWICRMFGGSCQDIGLGHTRRLYPTR